MKTNNLIFVLGGARSGKSTFAQQLAENFTNKVIYIATAQALDAEMTERIQKHQKSRSSKWVTLEAPHDLIKALSQAETLGEIILIDCLTLYLSNLILQKTASLEISDNDTIDQAFQEVLLSEIKLLLHKIKKIKGTIILVSNEVGEGIVPPYYLGRYYRDVAGYTNQLVAAQADYVYYLQCGLAKEIKKDSISPREAFLKIQKST